MNPNPKVVPFERGADFIRQRAMKNFRANNIVEALELMRKAVETSPENDDYRLELAQLLCDAGCPNSSSRLLLDMIARGVNTDECMYGLAINQLNMNNPEAARRLLRKCLDESSSEELRAQAEQLTGEIDMFETLNRPATRRTERMYSMTDAACERMRDEDVEGAVRLFERVLKMDENQPDVRALLSMAYMMQNRRGAALALAESACAEDCKSVRALSVSAQVYNMAGLVDKAHALLKRATAAGPDPLEMRMLIFSMFEAGMYSEARTAAQEALSETPCDRQLLHAMAVISLRLGEDAASAEQYWKRIVRIDPDDTIAAYYCKAAQNGELDVAELNCEYQVPRREMLARYITITEKLNGDLFSVGNAWRDDAEFRGLVGWCLLGGDRRFREAAVTLLASIDDPAAESQLREYLMRADSGFDMTIRAAAMYRLRGEGVERILPPYIDTGDGIVPEADDVLENMGVGHRQLVRLAGEVLERSYGVDAYDKLAVMWDMYRRCRRTRTDPLVRTETAAAALAYCYLEKAGKTPQMERLAVQYRCNIRQLRFFTKHLSATLEKGGAAIGSVD